MKFTDAIQALTVSEQSRLTARVEVLSATMRREQAERTAVDEMIAALSASMDEVYRQCDIVPPDVQTAALVAIEEQSSAALSSYHGEIAMDALPEETREAINQLYPNSEGLRIRKFGMTASELLPKADPHNLQAARHRIRHTPCYACAEEVHANTGKHVLIHGDRVVDGHHHLAKAEKGKVTKSLPVLDLIPALRSVA